MKNQILVKRYNQGLVNSLKDEAGFSALHRELSVFNGLLQKNKRLKDILFNPFLPKSRKSQIAQELLTAGSFGRKVVRFILLLLENNRINLLPEIIQALPDAWNEEKGIDTYEVASVVPLSADQKRTLKEKLEQIERKPVVVKYGIDPQLVGGLWIQKKNIVYDISIRGNLSKLKEKIIEG